MKKLLLAGVAVLLIAGSTAVYAQHRGYGWHHQARTAPEDRAAFLDARIAAVHAGLKLNAEQDKLWPPLETAVRDFVKLRLDRANARMQERDSRESRDDRRADARRDADPVASLRQRAETMGENSKALTTIADAADPLYKTLDESQKRRLAVLSRIRGPFADDGDGGPRMRGFRDDDRGEFDRGPRRERDQGRDRDRGPERL